MEGGGVNAAGYRLDRGRHGRGARSAIRLPAIGSPAMMELGSQPHHEPRLLRGVEVDLGLRGSVCLVDLGLGRASLGREVRRLRSGRIGTMATRAIYRKVGIPD